MIKEEIPGRTNYDLLEIEERKDCVSITTGMNMSIENAELTPNQLSYLIGRLITIYDNLCPDHKYK